MVLQEDLIDEVGTLVRRLWKGRRVAVITQARVERLHGERLERSLAAAGVGTLMLRMPEGEAKKSLTTVSRLYDRLIRERFTRDDAILAFGGGTVGDTAGFVAATFMRGIPFAQLPTTLLAQIDSAIGAKVGVNHPRGKNLIGAIYRPSAVWLDPSLLATLPERELRSGLFELVKYGFIGVPRLLRRAETERLTVGSKALTRAIAEGVRRKLDVVREDEMERGLRRILNFGHTIGHGLEAASSYQHLRHGEAVGWGMVRAVELAARRGKLPAPVAERLRRIVEAVGPLPSLGTLSARKVLAAIQVDKKRARGGLRFVLPVGWGRVEIVERFPADEIAWALNRLGVGR